MVLIMALRTRAAADRRAVDTIRVRAGDLTDADTALINGEWREVLDVYDEECDPTDIYTEDSPEWRRLTREVIEGFGRIGVRYVVEELSTPLETDDALAVLRAVELVEVQVPKSNEKE